MDAGRQSPSAPASCVDGGLLFALPLNNSPIWSHPFPMNLDSISALLEAPQAQRTILQGCVDLSGDDAAPATSASSMGDSSPDASSDMGDLGDLADMHADQDQHQDEDAERNAAPEGAKRPRRGVCSDSECVRRVSPC